MSEPLAARPAAVADLIAPRLDDGRVGVVGKAHHCMVDGIAAVELGSLLLDPTPEPAAARARRLAARSPRPGTSACCARRTATALASGSSCATLPARAASLAPARRRSSPGEARRAPGALADSLRPARSSRRSTSRSRRGATSARLEPPARRPAAGQARVRATVNDVVLAASAGGVRRFLAERGERPVRAQDDGAGQRPRRRATRASSATGSRSCSSTCPATSPTRCAGCARSTPATGERKDDGTPEGGRRGARARRLRAAAAAATRSRG